MASFVFIWKTTSCISHCLMRPPESLFYQTTAVPLMKLHNYRNGERKMNHLGPPMLAASRLEGQWILHSRSYPKRQVGQMAPGLPSAYLSLLDPGQLICSMLLIGFYAMDQPTDPTKHTTRGDARGNNYWNVGSPRGDERFYSYPQIKAESLRQNTQSAGIGGYVEGIVTDVRSLPAHELSDHVYSKFQRFFRHQRD